MDWSFVALLAITAVTQAFIAAAWVVVGGLGGQWRVNQALSRQAQELSRVDERLTRDQNTRAGLQRQEKVREIKSLEVQAAEHLAAAKSPYGAEKRPSTVSMINGGG